MKTQGHNISICHGGKMAYVFHCNITTGCLLLIKNNGNETLGVIGKAQIMLGHRNLWLFCECSNPITACRSLVYNVSRAGQVQQLACFSIHLRRDSCTYFNLLPPLSLLPFPYLLLSLFLSLFVVVAGRVSLHGQV